jgi:hypothetical protein
VNTNPFRRILFCALVSPFEEVSWQEVLPLCRISAFVRLSHTMADEWDLFYTILSYVVDVLSGLSIGGALLTIITFTIFKDIRTYPIKLIVYLCASIFLAQVFFILGTERWSVMLSYLSLKVAALMISFQLFMFMIHLCVSRGTKCWCHVTLQLSLSDHALTRLKAGSDVLLQRTYDSLLLLNKLLLELLHSIQFLPNDRQVCAHIVPLCDPDDITEEC